MSTLSNYANASAGNREERIARIFARLNTKDTFQPMELKNLVDVSNNTIFGYLKTIQNAQMLLPEYQNHLKKGFEHKSYAKTRVESQLNHAQIQYNEWLKRLDKTQNYTTERKYQLKQFQFQTNQFVSIETLWDRLEHSLLVFSLLSK